MSHITLKQIREKYIIDVERSERTISVYLRPFILNGKYTKDELIKKISTEISDEHTIEFDYIGYDGGIEINIYRTETRPETDKEVELRLQKIEKRKLKDISVEQEERDEYERLKSKFES